MRDGHLICAGLLLALLAPAREAAAQAPSPVKPSPSAPLTPPAPTPSRAPPMQVAGFVVLGAGAITIGVGLGLAGARLGPGSGGTVDSAPEVGLSIAGVGLLVALIGVPLIVLAPSNRSPGISARVGPIALRSGAGLGIQGCF